MDDAMIALLEEKRAQSTEAFSILLQDTHPWEQPARRRFDLVQMKQYREYLADEGDGVKVWKAGVERDIRRIEILQQ